MSNAVKPLPADEPGNLRPPFDNYTYLPRNTYTYFEDAAAHPFQFRAEGFEKVNAWWLSDAATLAYSDESTVRYWCEKAGFDDVAWYQSPSTQCFIAMREDYVFVVFCYTRGSGKKRRWRDRFFDWRIRLATSLVAAGNRGSVNRLAGDALGEIWDVAPTSIYGAGIGAFLDAITRDHPNATFWFAGHGYGGALATLAASRFPRVAGLYTFGSPRIGDRLFQRSLDLPAWSFVNNGDLVTRLPVIGKFRPLRFPLLGKYRRTGELKFIDSSGRIQPAESLWSSSRLDPITYILAKVGWLRGGLADSAPLRYSVRIWNDYVGSPSVEPEPDLVGFWRTASTALRWSASAIVVLLTILVIAVGLSLILRLFPDREPNPVTLERPLILETGLGSDREEFYSLAEGSEVFPRAFADAARQRTGSGVVARIRDMAKGQKPFLENLERYGFIPVPKTIDNPYGYVGLTVRRRLGTGIEMIGVNCAACHVGQIEYQGKAIRIDGAPNLLDIFGFFGELADSLTSLDLLVLLKEIRVSVKDMTVDGLKTYFQQLDNMKKMNQPTNTPPLPGRADAFGTARAMFFADFRPLNAPASYPHIWGFEHTAWYHWNANTNSVLERNIGQALGLGAGIDLEDCKTTIDLDTLTRMEQLGYKIGPPIWPDELGRIDQASAMRGREIYMGEGGCANCHENYTTLEDGVATLNDYHLLPLSVIKTDPNEALSAIPHVRQREDVCHGNKGPLERMGFGKGHEVLLGRVHMDARVKHLSDAGLYNGGRSNPVWRVTVLCEDPSQTDFKGRSVNDCPVYPSKPHLGVWATAPYLHNGSVPTLWDMLKPPDQRPKKFNVGQREYDPVHVGYAQSDPPRSDYPIFDTALDGNHNSGHEFGTQLSDSQKRDLIEFLKSITPEIESEMHTEVMQRVK
jgi:pimeloyl-ACP methyl ester carboxylesterase